MMGEPDQMNRPDSDPADTFTELQKALLGTETLEQFLHELATLAARLVTDGVSCGMTMRGSGRPVTLACSDPLAKEIDEVQYLLDDGPCLHAMRSGDQVSIDDTADRARWPRFEAAAHARGVQSCLALPLVAGAGSVATSPPGSAIAAATLGYTSISLSTPVRASTRVTAGALAASRSPEPCAAARWTTRTRAAIPAESQNVVAVMSAITRVAPCATADSRSWRTSSALARSISAGTVMTATRPTQTG